MAHKSSEFFSHWAVQRMTVHFYLLFILVVTAHFDQATFADDSLHVVIVSTSYNSLDRLTSLQHTKIGLDYALKEYNLQKNSWLNLAEANITYELVYVLQPNSTGCPDAPAVINEVVRFYYGRTWSNTSIMTFITSGCGDSLLLGDLGREWNVFVMTTASMYGATQDRLAYPSFISVSPIQASMGAAALLTMLVQYNWTYLTIVYDNAGVAGNNDLISAIIEQTQQQQRTFRVQLTLLSVSTEPMNKLLLMARSVSRIIYLSMHPTMVRKFMDYTCSDFLQLTAHSLNMTNGEYVYFVPQLARSFINGNLTWQLHDQYDEVAFAAYRSLFQLTPCLPKKQGPSQLEPFQSDLANISRSEYHIPFLPGDDLPTDVTTAAYYGFHMLDTVVRQLWRQNSLGLSIIPTKLSGHHIAANMLGRSFSPSPAETIFIDHTGQRRSEQCFRDLDLETGTFKDVLIFQPKRGSSEFVANTSIDWGTADGRPPSNVPLCGFNEDNIHCQRKSSLKSVTVTAVVIIGLLIVTIFLISPVVLRKQIKKNSTDSQTTQDDYILNYHSLKFLSKDLADDIFRGYYA